VANGEKSVDSVSLNVVFSVTVDPTCDNSGVNVPLVAGVTVAAIAAVAIVFLALTCSVKSLQRKIWPFMQRRKTEG
jgi:cadmium resistance protein CadD (predicted permease)